MKVCLITCTKGRHQQLERVVRFSLNQTSDNWTHLIYNNSCTALRLNANLPEDKYLLVNNCHSYETGKHYTTLGEIYNDAITHIPEDCDVVNFFDDDDIFFPSHVEEGIKGLTKGGKKAYKPQKSYYKHGKVYSLVENVLEPSIFVLTSHIKGHGFSSETTAQHLKWLDPLVHTGEIFVDPEGKPTYICNWGDDIPTFKTSGNPGNPTNFDNYSNFSQDNGDFIITPCSSDKAKRYYKMK